MQVKLVRLNFCSNCGASSGIRQAVERLEQKNSNGKNSQWKLRRSLCDPAVEHEFSFYDLIEIVASFYEFGYYFSVLET